jgi:hypothetical protein
MISGNSKYHYYGIRVKANSPLNSIPEDHALPSRLHATTTINPSKRLKTTMFDNEYKNTTTSSISQDIHHNTTTTTTSSSSSSSSSWTPTSIANNNTNGHQQQVQTTILSNNNEVIQGNTPNGGSILSSVINNTPPPPPSSSSSTITPTVTMIVQSSSTLAPQAIEAETKTQEFINLINSLPHLGNINVNNINLPDNCTSDDVKKFEDLYKNHCQVCFY